MSAAGILKLTPEEYLARERAATYKSEFIDGEVYAMSGASWEHNGIVANLSGMLASILRDRPCRPFFSDQRVRIYRHGDYVYPDAGIVCGQPQFEDKMFDTLLNPTVIFEVLSKSTQSFDRGVKFDLYAELPTLVDYVLIDQEQVRMEHFIRQPGKPWLYEVLGSGAILKLVGPSCELAVDEIYHRVFDFRKSESVEKVAHE